MKKIFTLFAATLFTAAAFAQLPNASFENWTAGGTGSASGPYDDPDNWGTANATIAGLPLAGSYTCEKGTTTAPDGAAYLKLTTKTILTSAVPGIAVTGTLNITPSPFSYSVTGGFPYTVRAANFTGKWQHMGTGADHGRVAIILSKWNATTSRRDTVAWADSTLTGMAMSWSDFTIPLKYKSSTLSPDTGMVVLLSSASTPVAGSYLYADKLAFTGTVPTGVVTVNMMDATTTVFPNPASGMATVYYHSTARKDLTVSLTDITGKLMKTTTVKVIAGENSFPIDLKNVAQGMYFVQLRDEDNVIQKKLIVE